MGSVFRLDVLVMWIIKIIERMNNINDSTILGPLSLHGTYIHMYIYIFRIILSQLS